MKKHDHGHISQLVKYAFMSRHLLVCTVTLLKFQVVGTRYRAHRRMKKIAEALSVKKLKM